jgi:hypothetical protein
MTSVGEDLVLIVEDAQNVVSLFCVMTSSETFQMDSCGIIDLRLL